MTIQYSLEQVQQMLKAAFDAGYEKGKTAGAHETYLHDSWRRERDRLSKRPRRADVSA